MLDKVCSKILRSLRNSEGTRNVMQSQSYIYNSKVYTIMRALASNAL